MATWTPINDFPGDQQYDAITGTDKLSFWGTIGTDRSGWSWTINATNDAADQWEQDGGRVATEAEAKAAVENWRYVADVPPVLPGPERPVPFEIAEVSTPDVYTAATQKNAPYTSIGLPDGELRIWEPAPDSDDASRMYVLDVLGIDVTLRWKRSEDGDLELYVAVLRDADSTPLGRGELTVEVDMDANSYGGIGEGPIVCPSTERHPGDIVGCGAIVTSPPDWEGFYDCGSCGMFFQLEGDRKEQPSS